MFSAITCDALAGLCPRGFWDQVTQILREAIGEAELGALLLHFYQSAGLLRAAADKQGTESQ